MAPEIAAALISGGLAVGGSVGSASIAGARNMKIARYSADFQRQQIAEQNAYNTPVAQMRRYVAAGLNPNLIYGQIEPGQQKELAKYDTPTLPTPDLGPILGGIVGQAMDLKLKQQELNLKKEEVLNKQYERWILGNQAEAGDRENILQSILTGIPYSRTQTLSPQERIGIEGSRVLRKYDLEVEGQEVSNTLNRFRSELTQFNAEHQRNIIDKILPLQEKLLDAQQRGENVENQIRQVEADLQKSLGSVGGSAGVRLIIDFLRAILK